MAKVKFTKEIYTKWFKQMMLIRRFEEKSAQLYGQQKIRGFCHLYIGQEAVIAGCMTALGENDKLITAYRDHGHAGTDRLLGHEARLCRVCLEPIPTTRFQRENHLHEQHPLE